MFKLWAGVFAILCIRTMGMKIFVRLTPHGPTYPLEVEPSDTIGSVKTQVLNHTGIPIDLQLLRFGSQDLEDALLLSDYNIQKESTLNLSVRAHLALHSVSSNHAQLTAGWLVTGVTYVVERATNLLAGSSWTPIFSFTAALATQRIFDPVGQIEYFCFTVGSTDPPASREVRYAISHLKNQFRI